MTTRQHIKQLRREVLALIAGFSGSLVSVDNAHLPRSIRRPGARPWRRRHGSRATTTAPGHRGVGRRKDPVMT